MAKEKKTADELKELFMQEIGKTPVLKDIESVTITPMKQMAPHHPCDRRSPGKENGNVT